METCERFAGYPSRASGEQRQENASRCTRSRRSRLARVVGRCAAGTLIADKEWRAANAGRLADTAQFAASRKGAMMSLLRTIGHTPFVTPDGMSIKLERTNPDASVRDRIAKFMLLQAVRRGELRPGDVILETTSGNTGIAIAMVGRELRFRVLVFMLEHITVERRLIIENLRADVRLTPKERGFDGAIAMRNEFRGKPGFYVPHQFGNPDNTLCQPMTTGPEILAQLEVPGCRRADCFVGGVGTGGP